MRQHPPLNCIFECALSAQDSVTFFDTGYVEPQMAQVVVLAENDLTVPAGHGIAVFAETSLFHP
jgi:hypothetical protein